MHQYEHENVKANLQRLAKIDEACEKDILERYLEAEINMYNTAKSFVQMYEAKNHCKENILVTKRSLRTVDNIRKREIIRLEEAEEKEEEFDY